MNSVIITKRKKHVKHIMRPNYKYTRYLIMYKEEMTMSKMKKIENELKMKMQSAFSSTTDRKKAVHLTATAGAGIVAVLPIGIDAWALRLAEVIMVICIASSYGEKLTKSAAKGIMLSSFAQLAGEAVAISALEAAEASKVATVSTGVGPVLAYAVKTSIAVALIESVGHMVIAYYEKPDSLGAKACQVTETVGLIADVTRAINTFSGNKTSAFERISSESSLEEGNEVSFKGNGRSMGHSEKYWKEKAAEALAKGDKSGYDFAIKRLKEAIENGLKK